MILTYSRNKYAATTDMSDGSLFVQTRVDDTVFSATMDMIVKPPLLEIISINGEILRACSEECQDAATLLQKAVGLQIGTGFIKTVNSLIGESYGCPRMADLVLEGCDQVILRFTVDPLRQILTKSAEELMDAHKMFVAGNPRLIGSCIAFSKESPLMAGVEL